MPGGIKNRETCGQTITFCVWSNCFCSAMVRDAVIMYDGIADPAVTNALDAYHVGDIRLFFRN